MKPRPETTPSRHRLLTAYLVLLIVANAARTILYLLAGFDGVRTSVPGMTHAMFVLLVAAGAFNVAAAAALLFRRKSGFWLFAVSNGAVFALDVWERGLASSANAWLGLLAVVLLYVLLRAGGKAAVWPNLR